MRTRVAEDLRPHAHIFLRGSGTAHGTSRDGSVATRLAFAAEDQCFAPQVSSPWAPSKTGAASERTAPRRKCGRWSILGRRAEGVREGFATRPSQTWVSRAARRRKRRRTHSGQLRFTFDEGAAGLPQFWQRRLHDFNVWSTKKRAERVRYLHMNAVKRGPVSALLSWRLSPRAGLLAGESEACLATIGCWLPCEVNVSQGRQPSDARMPGSWYVR